MSTEQVVILIAISFLTSLLSVVTGSTSLITVPAMISLGMEPHVAIATNMLALTFMSLGGPLPFVRTGAVDRSYLPGSLLLTALGSGLGALLLLAIPVRTVQLTVAIAMIAVMAFMLLDRDLGLSVTDSPVSRRAATFGYLATFLLAAYGGFFSGGYVTMLTATFVVLFGMTLLRAVATTKVVNLLSSAVATGVFLWRGVVDIRLGVILGMAMFCGALLGARVTLRLAAVWIRRIFLAAVLGLALRMLAPLFQH
jgi:uncharacterized protein